MAYPPSESRLKNQLKTIKEPLVFELSSGSRCLSSKLPHDEGLVEKLVALLTRKS